MGAGLLALVPGRRRRRSPAPARRPRARRFRRRGFPAPSSLVLGTAVAAALVLGTAGLGRYTLPGTSEGPEPEPLPPLPALPVIPASFQGPTIDAYLRPPAVHLDHMDELLASPVLADAEFTEAVHWWVHYWTVYATRWFPGFLDRMALRGAPVDAALGAYGFPPSLRYLPLIESGYDPRVTSRSGAVGMWQLMPTTARGLGLTVNAVLDERRDAEKSTEAALRYIESLQAEFGSWFLTLAAYNSGPTRVRGILRRHAPDAPRTDSLFWALRHRFPLETREFVPKLYGAMFVASRPDAYGYESLDGQRFVFRPRSETVAQASPVP